jgi:hypothetical protein
MRRTNTMKFTRIIALTLFASLAFISADRAVAQQAVPLNSYRASHLSFVAGKFVANEYATYGGTQAAQIYTGNASTGSATITVRGGYVTLNDGRKVVPFAVGVPIVINDTTPEMVTPTAVSGCYASQGMNQDAVLVTCNVTASFSFTHGVAAITSGTGGLAEAIQDAFLWGGGVVVIEPGFFLNTSCTNCFASLNAAMAGVLPYASVSIEDDRQGPPQYWGLTSNATFLAAPATLTATTVGFGLNGANTTGGSYNGASTYHYCIAYVDVAGNEGPCSADFSAATAGSGSTNQIGFAAPAASAGAVGYVPYISLAGGTYALAYRVPVSSSVCTLTKIETVIAACAVTNATYGQTGSNAVVSALTVNTARLAAQLGAASTTSDIVSNSAGHTAYIYAPGAMSPAFLPIGSYAPFTVTTAAATTVPAVLGTIQLPAGFMNIVGRTIRICGHASQASAGSTATIENVQFFWDADGSNTTGAGVQIGNGLVSVVTLVTANADSYSFCGELRTTVSGAGATAGSIQAVGGMLVSQSGAAGTQASGAGGDTSVGATASLNLAGEARIDVVYNHTTGTDANGLVLQNLTVEVLN